MGAFGEKLRKQREQRGLELDAISNTTKISPRMLRALEDEHFDQLPGGVFNKGFVRAYARQVGLDEEEAITEYLAALRESQIQQQSILPDFRGPAARPVPAGAPNFRKPNPTADDHSGEDPPDNPLRGADLHGNDLRDTGLRRHDLPGEDLQGEVLHGKDLAGNEFRGDKPSGKDHRTLSPELRRADYRNTDHRDTDQRNTDHRNDEESIPSSPRSTPQPRPAHLNRYPAASLADSSTEPSARVPWGTLAAALLLVTLLLAFWNLRRHPDSTAASNTATSSHPSAVATQAPPPAQTSISPAPLAVGKNSPVETLSAGTLSPGTISADTTSSSVPTRTSPGPSPSSKTEAHPAVSNGASDSGKPAATASTLIHPPLAKTRTPAAAKPPATFTLLIHAEKTTWVSIVADGKSVAEETLIAPAHTSIHALHEIYVRVGNAAGLSFVLNGKEIPARGNEGEVKTYVFNAAGLQSAPQPAAANR